MSEEKLKLRFHSTNRMMYYPWIMFVVVTLVLVGCVVSSPSSSMMVTSNKQSSYGTFHTEVPCGGNVHSFTGVVSHSHRCCTGFCRNGGHCNETTNECDCDPYFTSDSRCYNLTCENSLSEHNNFCNCKPGWTGVYCEACENSQVCYDKFGGLVKHKNDTLTCDKSLISYNQLQTKVFTCNVKKEGIWSAVGDLYGTFYCPGMTNSSADNVCDLAIYTTTPQTWAKKPPGYQYQIFYCSGRQCTQKAGIDEKGDMISEFNCLRTNCSCTYEYPCPPILENFLKIMTDASHFKCNGNTTWCSFEQDNLKFLMNLNCTASECILNPHPIPPIPPPPPFNYKPVIAVSATVSGILLIMITLTVIHFIYSRIENKNLYKMWKEQNEATNFDIEFRNIRYSIQKFGIFSKKHTVLHGVSGGVKQGKVLAIMGASGAGKTTLLDILAGRNKSGIVSGDIFVGGKAIDKSYQLVKGYVLQQDIMLETMTVKEYLMFSANLRLPEYVTYKEKGDRVESVMKDLGIAHLANQRIGSNMRRGLSGGEKRRVAIGAELVVSKPIIFCDEPTSGLDSYNAHEVMACLHNLAVNHNKTIVCSIHQPSSSIFSLIDELLLLSDGKVAYSGPANAAAKHFANLGFEKPADHSTPDFLLDLIVGACRQSKSAPVNEPFSKVHKRRKSEKRLLGSSTNQNSDYDAIINSSEKYTSYQSDPLNLPLTGTSAKHAAAQGAFMTSFYKQFAVLAVRAFKNFIRNFWLFPAHLLFAVLMGLFLGLVFYQLPMDLNGTQDRIGAMFFMTVVLSFVAMSSLELFVSEREIFVTERASGYYRAYTYYFSRMVFDVLPLRVLPPIVMGLIAYYMMGLRQDSFLYFVWFILFLVLFNVSIGGICLCISSVVNSVTVGNMIFLIINLFTMLFGGLLVNPQSLPVPLKYFQYISPYKFTLEALLTNEMRGRTILFNPPDAEYVFTMRAEKILEIFGFNVNNFALDLGVISALGVTTLMFAGILLRFCVKERR